MRTTAEVLARYDAVRSGNAEALTARTAAEREKYEAEQAARRRLVLRMKNQPVGTPGDLEGRGAVPADDGAAAARRAAGAGGSPVLSRRTRGRRPDRADPRGARAGSQPWSWRNATAWPG